MHDANPLSTTKQALSTKLRSTVAAGFALAASVLVQGEAAAQTSTDIWLLNETGREIQAVYFRVHGPYAWNNDVLGVATLPNGLGTKIDFLYYVQGVCVMDMRVEYADGDWAEWTQGRDFCNNTAIHLRKDNMSVPLVRRW